MPIIHFAGGTTRLSRPAWTETGPLPVVPQPYVVVVPLRFPVCYNP